MIPSDDSTRSTPSAASVRPVAVDETSAPPPPSGKRRGWRNPWVLLATFGVVALVAAVLFLRRGSSAAAAERAATASATPDMPRVEGDVVRFTPAFAARAHLKVGLPVREALAATTDVTGTVDFDAEKVSSVGARIGGRVRAVYKFEGDAVERGTVLADLESASLGEAESARISARAHAEAAAADDARMKDLEEAHAASKRDAERAHAAARTAEADLQAAEQRVRAYGGDSSGEPGILKLRAPLAGKIVQRSVTRGQTVDPTLTAFMVADLSQLWVQLAVFERELPFVHEGDEAELTPQDGSQDAVKGRVSHVGEIIDKETRSALVRVVVDNGNGHLRPGQSVLAHIKSGTANAPALIVPREAVVTVDGKATVFVAHDETSVSARRVELGAKDATRFEVTSGLKEGEQVIVEGAFALKSELFR